MSYNPTRVPTIERPCPSCGHRHRASIYNHNAPCVTCQVDDLDRGVEALKSSCEDAARAGAKKVDCSGPRTFEYVDPVVASSRFEGALLDQIIEAITSDESDLRAARNRHAFWTGVLARLQ